MSGTIFICEKPSQMEDLAAALGGGRKLDQASMAVSRGVIVAAAGHLLELADPAEVEPALARPWRLDPLPWVPKGHLPMRVRGTHAARVKTIGRHLHGSTRAIICTDAGREGEAIARMLLEFHKFKGEVLRLWLNRMDAAGVKKAMENLLAGAKTEPLYFAARARAHADLAVGLNFSRIFTLLFGESGQGFFSAGRVQTPTLAFIVRREREIRNFVPVRYFVLRAQVQAADLSLELTHPFEGKDEDRILDRAQADALSRTAAGAGGPLRIATDDQDVPPPPPFSLLSLQKEANQRWGWTAAHTLEVAQKLYERHKCTSYPRTECPFLEDEQANEVAATLAELTKVFPKAAAAVGKPIVRRDIFNTAKVVEHHGIIPLAVPAPIAAMAGEEKTLYALIAARYLAALMPDAVFSNTVVKLDAGGCTWGARGRMEKTPGWRAAYDITGSKLGKGGQAELPAVRDGSTGTIASVKVEGLQTKPPARYAESTLLEAMKGAAKFVSDPRLKALLRGTEGIGTAATRAKCIEDLKARGYVEAEGRTLVPTPKGVRFIGLVEKSPAAFLADPAETALWEGNLDRVAKGEMSEEEFLSPTLRRFEETARALIEAGGNTVRKS